MSFTVNKLDVVFFQRKNDNSEYEQVNISGSSAIFYLDDDGILTAGNISEILKNGATSKKAFDNYQRDILIGETIYSADTLTVGTPNRLSKYYAIPNATQAFKLVQTETNTIDTPWGIGIGKALTDNTVNATLDVSGSVIITGSLVVTKGIKGLINSASYAITASFLSGSANSSVSSSYSIHSVSSSVSIASETSDFSLLSGNSLNSTSASYSISSSFANIISTGTTSSRSESDRWIEYGVNVKDCGAIGANISSAVDRDAFNAAITLAKKKNTFIYMPSGSYQVNISTDARCGMIGESRRSVVLRPYDPTLPVVNVDIGGFTGTSSYKERGLFENFQINCLDNSGITAQTGTIGLRVGQHLASYAGNSTNVFRNISIYSAGLDGLDIKDATDCLFEHINVEDCGRYGIFTEAETSFQSCTFICVKARQNHSGMYLQSGNHLLFQGCSFDSNRNVGIYLLRQNSSGPSSARFVNCWSENSGYNRTLSSSISGTGTIPAVPDGQATAVYLDSNSAVQGTTDFNVVFETCNFAGAASDGNGGTAPYDVRVDRGEAIFDRCTFTPSASNGFSPSKFRYSTSTGGAVHVLLKQCGELNVAPTPTMYTLFPDLTVLTGQSTLGSYGYKYEFEWLGRKYSNNCSFAITGSPLNIITPGYEGERILDTTHSERQEWVAMGTTSGSWRSRLQTTTGQFTPTVSGSSTIGTATYATQIGTYVKTGTVVSFAGRVAWSSHTGTGSMSVGGLPFPAKANPFVVPVVTLTQDILYPTSRTSLGGLISGTDTSFAVRGYGSNLGAAAVSMSINGTIDFSATYEASS